MPSPKPPTPDVPAALATNPMADFGAQNLANAMQQAHALAETQALAEAAAAIRAAVDPTPPAHPPSER